MSHLASQIISTKRALTSFSIIQLRWRMSKRQNSSHGALDNVVETAGIEPAFSPCKSDVLPLNYVPGRWSGWPDLNLRPHAPKTRALPDCATPRCYGILAEGVGFEPTGGITPPAIFKTAAFNRSATLPWGRCGDSNPEPSDYKSAALPIEPHRRGWPGVAPGLNLFAAVLPLPDTRLHT